MTLATILALTLMIVGSWPGVLRSPIQDGEKNPSGAATPQAQPSPSQPVSSGSGSMTPTAQPQSPSSPDKSSAGRHHVRKKASERECTNSSTTPGKPCPPQKVVIKDGGSDQPVVALKGDTSEEQASYQRYTTEQLTAATEENLKKITARTLNESQQETASQIKQFMDQAKAAVASGDLNRAHNLAIKARLLSDELVKP